MFDKMKLWHQWLLWWYNGIDGWYWFNGHSYGLTSDGPINSNIYNAWQILCREGYQDARHGSMNFCSCTSSTADMNLTFIKVIYRRWLIDDIYKYKFITTAMQMILPAQSNNTNYAFNAYMNSRKIVYWVFATHSLVYKSFNRTD